MFLLAAVIPFTMLHLALPRKPRLQVGCFLFYLFLFSRIPSSLAQGSGILAHVVSRIGIVGVVLMAVISGYGSVLNPMRLFLRRPSSVISSEDLLTYQQRCAQATAQLQTKKSSVSIDQPVSTLSWIMKRFDGEGEELADLEAACDSMQSEYERLKLEKVN